MESRYLFSLLKSTLSILTEISQGIKNILMRYICKILTSLGMVQAKFSLGVEQAGKNPAGAEPSQNA